MTRAHSDLRAALAALADADRQFRRLVETYDRGRPDLEDAYLAQVRASDASDRAMRAARQS